MAHSPALEQIFETAFVVRVALNIVEDVTWSRLRQQIKALTGIGQAQLIGGRSGFAGMLQTGLHHQTRPCVFGHAADRVVEPGQRFHRRDAGCLEFFDLAAADIGDVEQAVLSLPEALAVIAPAAEPTIGTRDRPGRRGVFQENHEPLARHSRIGLIVGEP